MTPKAPKGFTLIELVIALTLVGMATSLLYAALHYGSRAWHQGERLAQRQATIALVWQRVDELLRTTGNSAVELPGRDKDHYLFSGDDKGVEFLATMSRETGVGRYIVRLEPRQTDGHQQLVLRRWLYHPEVVDGSASLPAWTPYGKSGGTASGPPERGAAGGLWYAESVLVEHLRRLSLSYRKAGQDTRWQGEWKERKELPALLRLEIEDNRGRWPIMVFALPST